MANAFLAVAAVLQGLAVGYGVVLASRRKGATAAWSFLLGAMLSMFVWRLVVLTRIQPPPFFNPLIAIWGSTCMVGAMFFFGREVALRKRAEAERDELLTSERTARSEAERASQLRDDFLATVSHELRTPLAAILGWIQVARNARDQDETGRAFEAVERNARAQARLVDDLLDVTRMQAGAVHLELAAVPLDVPVRAALQSVRPSADAKSIAIDVECGPEVPIVRGDAGRLQQVAANLLVNAVKFTPQGGSVTVTVGVEGGRARLAVADNGVGIDPELLPQLFGRFRQADSTATRRHGGLGLGLSIVASLVRLHGGEVQAASPGPRNGATFSVTLPLAAQGAIRNDRPTPSWGVTTVGLRDALRGMRILLVDDEVDVRSAVSRLLEQTGAKVVALEGGAHVEQALAEHRPDVLLIDIGMPFEDGYTLVRRIRKLPTAAGGRTPAISLTAHARNEDRNRALDSGFQDHLPKPIDTAALVVAIRAAAATPCERRGVRR